MSAPSASGDPGELYPRPIIKEEDLRRMDEISGDDGWAAFQDEPDYDKKLFNDDDAAAASTTNESKDRNNQSGSSKPPASSVQEDELSRADRDGKWADNIQAQGRAIGATTGQQQPPPQVQLLSRTDRSGGPFPLRRDAPPSSSTRPGPHTLDEEEFWKEQQQRQKSVEMKAALRAKEMR